MVKKVSTLIAGGTYFGIGYASAHQDCMILEESQILGSDFHRNLRTADMQSITLEETRTELGRLMMKYHVLEKDRFDVLKSAPVLHEYCYQKDFRIVLDARMLSVEKTDGGYHVRYITNSGIHELHCREILDTTVLRDTYPEGIECIAKTLNFFTVCLEDTFAERLRSVAPDCSIVDGMNPDEKIVKIPFSTDTGLPEAYEAVVDLWTHAFPQGEEKILFLAQDFDYKCSAKSEQPAPCAWIGTAFANPLTAFARGMKYLMPGKGEE